MPEMDIFTDTSDKTWGYMWAHILIQKTGAPPKHQLYSDNTTTLAYFKKYCETTFPKLLKIEEIWTNFGFSDTILKVSNMVFGRSKYVGRSTTSTKSEYSESGYKKRKIAFLGEQTTEYLSMENQRRALKKQTPSDFAIDVAISKKRNQKQKSRHFVIRRRFLDPRSSENAPLTILAPEIVNFLQNSLEDNTIKSFVQPKLDILPIIIKFKDWGPTSKLSDRDLTAKLCWLLAIAGFLRASDIHITDNARSNIMHVILYLEIVANKEKRGGIPIEKPCQINEHSDQILCPVYTYKIIKKGLQGNYPYFTH
ncbi:hypothetical protein BB560_007195 [Smittium megazygosporum]|uniref:Uncharacterized protein n=1 Tax=Smittium megazygosporum TaxID=133381 RepID=A0A2T9XY48_9FUNG|nr:hypothetical protein BB560_007195 [Smittium megazygosporum]